MRSARGPTARRRRPWSVARRGLAPCTEAPRVFDQHDAVGGLGHLGQERVDKRRLAGRRAPRNKNVEALLDGFAKNPGLLGGDNSRGDIVVECEDSDRRLADRERWRRNDRRDQSFEALAGSPAARLTHAGMPGVPPRRHGGRRAARSARRRRPRSCSPVSARPSVSRSTHRRPSGLSITSTTAGSSSQAAIEGPSRRAQHPRSATDRFSLERKCPHNLPPVTAHGQSPGMIRKGKLGMTQQVDRCRSMLA